MAGRRLAGEGPGVTRRSIVGRWVAASVAALATVAAMTMIAGAHDTDLNDPNDTPGKLDVRIVRLAHEPGPPTWTIVTHNVWRIAEMWDRGYLMVMLDTEGGPASEYYLLVRSVRTTIEGSLWRVRAVGPDSHLGSVPAKKITSRAVRVQVGLSRLTFGSARRHYRWRVQTVFTSDDCRRTCHDRAPNGEGVLQWRPGMSPTPTPSESPDP
jgi:hypothetical protein